VVSYHRLDSDRKRTGSKTTSRLAVFLASFYPETG
jgi:hypothetical protein